MVVKYCGPALKEHTDKHTRLTSAYYSRGKHSCRVGTFHFVTIHNKEHVHKSITLARRCYIYTSGVEESSPLIFSCTRPAEEHGRYVLNWGIIVKLRSFHQNPSKATNLYRRCGSGAEAVSVKIENIETMHDSFCTVRQR